MERREAQTRFWPGLLGPGLVPPKRLALKARAEMKSAYHRKSKARSADKILAWAARPRIGPPKASSAESASGNEERVPAQE
jgi:hypothetical protein